MNLDFNQICRLCLRFCEKYVDLNQTNGVKSLSKDLVEKIKFCYLMQMDLSEGLPTKVCYECIQVISFFYIAKKNVIISEQLLRDVLYVRKKLQDEAKIQKEENVTGSDIIKIKSEKEKTNQSSSTVSHKPQNINTVKLHYSDHPENKISLDIECKKDTPMSDNSAKIVNFKHHSDFKVNKKQKKQLIHNNELRKSLNNKSGASLTFMELKKLHSQSKRNSKSFKDNPAQKEAVKTDTTLEEYVVKEIGTVIDTSNILSPDVKRTRKSVLARSS